METPIHTELDEDELSERLDAIDAELSELDGQVQQLVEAAAQLSAYDYMRHRHDGESVFVVDFDDALHSRRVDEDAAAFGR